VEVVEEALNWAVMLVWDPAGAVLRPDLSVVPMKDAGEQADRATARR